jgi:DNA mismatch endonuclease, patch repair protein
MGGGVRLPYAEPTSAAATAMGKANKRSDTKPEIALRSALHRRGHRFRKDYPIRVPGRRPIRPDIVFTRQRLAIFVDGCFWHRCEQHFVMPKSNTAYWDPKFEANVRRDRLVDDVLSRQGWMVLRIWEHTPVDEALSAVEPALQ